MVGAHTVGYPASAERDCHRLVNWRILRSANEFAPLRRQIYFDHEQGGIIKELVGTMAC